MKREMILLVFFISLILIASLINAEENPAAEDESSKINQAYSCLREKIDDKKCNTLSFEQKIFSYLAVGKCMNEIITDSENNKECWKGDSSKCTIKATAQGILALDSTEKAEEWLLSKKITPLEIVWYLQIESNEETTCTVNYKGTSRSVVIGDDKKIKSGGGGCLTLSENNYWIRVSQECYGEEIQVSCDKSFQTNLLYKKTNSPAIYVSDQTHSADSGASTTEIINSHCLSTSNTCDYEGTLWAAMVLDRDYDISSFLPYLITMETDYPQLLPESFLYYLTNYNEFRSQLVDKQKPDGYWKESQDEFYDTAVALYSMSSESTEKTNAKKWLLNVQGKDGCWDNGNIRNTAFLLHSIWATRFTGGAIDIEEDCEDNKGYCMSSISCNEAGGNTLPFKCGGVFVCCDSPKKTETCSSLNGKICDADYNCEGQRIEASDLNYGEICCIGECSKPTIQEESECKKNGGMCKALGCDDKTEETLNYNCDYSSDYCCKRKTTIPAESYWWIWVLGVLIILLIIAIIYREKLRHFWFRIKSGKTKPGPPRGPQQMFPMTPSSMIPQRRLIPRHILPPSSPRPTQKREEPKKSEFDEVLRKLKEMGK